MQRMVYLAVQTAEGALTEVHSMLQRMNELATQVMLTEQTLQLIDSAIQDEISSAYQQRLIVSLKQLNSTRHIFLKVRRWFED